MSDRTEPEELPRLIQNPKSEITYSRGCFLGKGGFARCYEFKNTTTGKVFAGKVLSKTVPHHKERILQEIRIHSRLSHKFIVSFHSYFEDESNMYIILELCRKRSLWEMHKRRKTLTVPEVRYFMKQIVLACKYLHEKKIIHRDLKLRNLFINDEMDIKVGDFGLATRLTHENDKTNTVCGTPDYIAPEILTKQGHRYEVDIWSLGCIMYTLLVGNPPFETSTLKNTYTKIKKCDYCLPPTLDRNARLLIAKLLESDPNKRPNADAILMDNFLTCGYIPSRLPISCLTMQPRFSRNMSMCEVSSRAPLTETLNIPKTNPEKVSPTAKAEMETAVAKADDVFKNQSPMPKDFYLGELLQMLEKVCRPETKYTGQSEDTQDPSAVPFVWISKWADHSDKYGIGYQLCDNSVGVFFNDATHLVLLQDGKSLQYIDSNTEEQYYTMQNHPKKMSNKILLLNKFNTYMTDKLVKAGEMARPRDGDELAHVPHLRAWFRTNSAMIFHLTNGTFQANFFKDHTKIILCPLMGAVSLIDKKRQLEVHTFSLIKKYGCSPLLASRLSYSKGMIEKLYTDLHTEL